MEENKQNCCEGDTPQANQPDCCGPNTNESPVVKKVKSFVFFGVIVAALLIISYSIFAKQGKCGADKADACCPHAESAEAK